MNRILPLIFFTVASLSGYGQESPAMADGLRSEGKIYVVIAVLAVIFIALAVYLFMLERRISRIERESQTKEPK